MNKKLIIPIYKFKVSTIERIINIFASPKTPPTKEVAICIKNFQQSLTVSYNHQSIIRNKEYNCLCDIMYMRCLNDMKTVQSASTDK